MTFDIALVYGIILATLVLFASDRLRLDVVALMALLALSLSGLLTVEESLAGFADPIVLMIAGLFVVGAGLFRTGVAARIALLPARFAGSSDTRLLAAIMVIVALLSGFMSSTGTVAIMLPVVMGLAWERGINPSRLLIPVSVAALLGGMLTLIGTAPNIVVANQLAASGRPPFGFFTFTPVGLAMVGAGIAFMLLVGRRLLPDRSSARPPDAPGTSVSELAADHQLPESLFPVRVLPGSPLAGRPLRDADLRSRYQITVADIRRAEPGPGGGALRQALGPGAGAGPLRQARSPGTGEPRPRPVLPDTRLEVHDVLLLHGHPDSVVEAAAAEGLERLHPPSQSSILPPDVGLVEVILTPRSSLIGHSVKEARFREKYRATVLSVRRLGRPLQENPWNARLRFGDTLLVKGPWKNIELLQAEHRDFVVASRPKELVDAGRRFDRAPIAAAVIVGMLLLMSFGFVAPVEAVLLAGLAMVLTQCVGVEDAYRSIHWESVVLIAAVLPMATALQKTGGLALIVEGIDAALGGQSPVVLLGALFLLTSALSQVISNTATAVLLAPIAMELAARTGAAPEPFLMGIAVAASTAFMTPIASPVNVLVLGPGGYRFSDFFRIGLLLQLLIMALSLAIIPLLFPFGR